MASWNIKNVVVFLCIGRMRKQRRFSDEHFSLHSFAIFIQWNPVFISFPHSSYGKETPQGEEAGSSQSGPPKDCHEEEEEEAISRPWFLRGSTPEKGCCFFIKNMLKYNSKKNINISSSLMPYDQFSIVISWVLWHTGGISLFCTGSSTDESLQSRTSLPFDWSRWMDREEWGIGVEACICTECYVTFPYSYS